MPTSAQTASTVGAPVVTIASGALRGAEEGGVVRFLGVPFAAAPVGTLRFASPAPHAGWNGVRDAMAKGPVAPQPTPSPEEMERALPGLDITPLIGDGWVEGDEYLLANIWAPSAAVAAPVMVFIHGGAFTGGCGSADVYDGSAFARAGVICVTINYRLGIEGFLPIPGAPTNLGLRDQIFALAWVRDNIAAFGGDPANVTVFGESAGAMSVANLVASPLARGLFKRAIIQSGHGHMVRPIDVAQRLVKKLAAMLRITPDVAGFRSRAVADCLKAQAKISQPTARINLRNADGREPAFGLSRFLPVYGDDVLPQHPIVALQSGVGAEVDVLIGTNTEEMNLYFVPSGVRRKIGKFLAHFVVRAAEPRGGDVLKAYGVNQRGKRPGDAFTEALTDLVFRLQARRFARAHRGRTHMYEFAWRSRAYNGELGACHAIELPFVFDTLSTVSGPKGLAGENPPQELALRMNKLWVDFAKTGHLPWPAYDDATRLVCTVDTGAIAREAAMPAEAIVP
ncbi:MAG: carboxylesterase/lipase family protein [Hyphomonadaceae bacterium]